MNALTYVIGISLLLTNIGEKFYLKNPSQKIKVVCTYRLTFQPDSTDSHKLSEYMILNVSDTVSEFISLNKSKRDSIINSNEKKGNYISPEDATDRLSTVLQAPKTKFTFRIHKFIDGTCLVFDNIGRDFFSYKEEKYPCIWTVEHYTSLISGYKCQMATTSFGGRKYEAWFTREIPVSDGPYKFSGLPGLIVKLYDSRRSYNFELVRVNKPTKEIFISAPKKPVLVQKEDFTKAVKAAQANLVRGIGPRGVTYSFSEDVKKRIQEKQKRNNNPIELQ